MTVNNRKIIILPFALEESDLRQKADYLGRQIPIFLRNCFEKKEPGRVVASPIATEKHDHRYWVVHKDLWRDEAARSFAKERGYDIVVFGILSGPSAEGSIRTLKLRSVMVESGKVVVDKTITGDIFRIIQTALEGMSVYASMIPKDAAALFDKESKSAPSFESYLRGLDVLLALRSEGIQLNNYDKALEPFDRALELDSDFRGALTAGLSCALQALESAGSEMSTDIIAATLQSWIKKCPGDPRIYAVLAEIFLGRDRKADALLALKQGLEEIRPPSRDLLRRSGDILSENGNHKEALKAYEACEALAHDSAMVERMSALNIMVGRSDVAREQIAQLLEEDSSRVDLWLRAGILAHRDNDMTTAWLMMSRMFDGDRAPGESELVKLNTVLSKSKAGTILTDQLRTWYPPESFSSKEKLLFAKTLRLAGLRVEAGLCLRSIREEALDSASRSTAARERLNLIHDGFDANFAAIAKRIVNEGSTEGKDLLDEAVTQEPQFWPARFLRGLILSKLGEYEESLCEMDLVLEAEPENDVVWYTRGLQLARLGEDEKAVESFESAIRINGKETDYHANLALSHARLHHEAQALEALKEVKTLRPKHPDNERLEQAIKDSIHPPCE